MAVISVDDLTAAGFREFKVPVASVHHRSADRFFQLCIRRDDGLKLYYVNVYLYDWRKYDKPGPAESLLFEVWAYTDDSRTSHVKVDLSPDEAMGLDAVMTYLKRAWEALSGIPYEDDDG